MKDNKLKILNQKIKSCKKCLLWESRENTVPGEGPINAKIIIIGQAPGAEEDKTGRPFIGRAGKLLDKLLKIANLKREKVFITSPIKCFPPKNRKPTKREIQICLPYLKEQIRVINPQKFILLGEIAFSIFFKNKKLKDYRGKWVEKDNKKYFITYHPAAGIRFVKFKKILEREFRKIKKIIDL
ncbi:MAG: uracil-DNA glycosylase [Candidatus Nealsonbacteria bacterium RBG_13_36_15]|uniref:Type-4 uracil-DNA glycosylase n=1 Tax=Candidatus Nealsonbacteria bacterium RBG_13_36_15 TaxID=1801660 RepID=A0A1G2DUU3_9BACT|nr:MAG: uracil-DNA glycosylase [Candidatus Nealsonbacteria bacterium RBG_13_36_15]